MAVVNDDNLREPRFAERLAAALDLHPEAAFALCDLTRIGPDGSVLSEATQHFHAPRAGLRAGPVGDTLAGHLRAQRYTVVGVPFRREALRLVGLREPVLGACLDHDLWIRRAGRGSPGGGWDGWAATRDRHAGRCPVERRRRVERQRRRDEHPARVRG